MNNMYNKTQFESLIKEKSIKSNVKKYGEVYTPEFLVEDMLNTLPENVWFNPSLKWLDPCVGFGTFFTKVIDRLMISLIDFEPNEKLRYKHIVENMLYSCELQEKNVDLYKEIFNINNEYALNIYCGSYLDKEFNNKIKDWGVEKFNIIVMNPPYQELKEGNKKSHPLWNKFVIKTVSELVEGGYLVAVHPSGWRNVDGIFKPVQNLLKSKQLLYLEIHDANDGVKNFGVATRYDFYCLHNVACTFNTKIKCQDGTIECVDISKLEFIPNGMFKEIQKLIAKDSEDTVNILYSRSVYDHRKSYMSKENTNEYTYPCIQNINIKNKISCLWYSNTNSKGHFGIPKVIFGRKCSGVYNDNVGQYGMAEDCCAIIDDTYKLPYIQKALLSANFIKISKQCDFGGSRDRYNRKIIALFRKDFWKEYQN